MRSPWSPRNPRRKGDLTDTGFLLTLYLQPPIGARNVQEGCVLKAVVRVLTAMHSGSGRRNRRSRRSKIRPQSQTHDSARVIGTPNYAPARLGPSLASSSDRPRGQTSVVPA